MRIYTAPLKAKIEEVARPLQADPLCGRCRLHEDARTVCLAPASFEEGALLVVAEKPTKEDDEKGEAQTGKTGEWLREQIARWWTGPVVFDYAVRCRPVGDITDGQIEACRPYLAWLLRQVNPSRVVCLGSKAVLSYLGRGVSQMTTRRGYGWLSERDVPVYELMPPSYALRNRFTRDWLLRDLRWALQTAPPTSPPWKIEMIEVRTAADAQACADACASAGGCAFDCEATGVQFEEEYKVIAVGVTPRATDVAYVWDEAALADAALRTPLVGLLEDPAIAKDGHNLKYDVHAVQLGLGVHFAGYGRDTRLLRKLLDSDADGRLGTMQELVGMGGAKTESEEAISIAKARRPPVVVEGQGSLFGEAPPPRASADRMKYVFGEIPRDVLLRRNATDAISTRRLDSLLFPLVEANAAAAAMWEGLLGPSTEALIAVERAGVRISERALEAADEFFRLRIEEIRPRLAAYADFDPDSQQQVAQLLYETLKLPATMTEKGNPSVNKDALLALKGKHPIVADILSYRWFAHMRGTYGCGSDKRSGLRNAIRGDGRAHPSFDPFGTRIGRLCVDGETLLETDGGTVPICKLDLTTGKTYRILSHRGNWKPITAVFRKGRERMFRIELDDGSRLECTRGHLVLSPVGWVHAGQLSPGTSVVSVREGVQATSAGRSVIRSPFSRREVDVEAGARQVRTSAETLLRLNVLLSRAISRTAERDTKREVCTVEDRKPLRCEGTPFDRSRSRQARALCSVWSFGSSNRGRDGYQRVPHPEEHFVSRDARPSGRETAELHRQSQPSPPGAARFPAPGLACVGALGGPGDSVRNLLHGTLSSSPRLAGVAPFRSPPRNVSRAVLQEAFANTDYVDGERGGVSPRARFGGCAPILCAAGRPQGFSRENANARLPHRGSSCRRDRRSVSPARGGQEKGSDVGARGIPRGILPTSIFAERCSRGSGRCDGAHSSVFGLARVVRVVPLGVRDVWDITVADDHSYVAGGFVNHNSCSDPNLQQIPREESEDGRTEGKLIRDAFIADDGWVLLSADYSQVELRSAAYLSGDPVMTAIFQRGEDIHQQTARLIAKQAWGIEPDAVRKPHRTKAKVINFSLAFGKGDASLAEDLGITVTEAKRTREAIFGKFAKLKAYKDACLAYARKRGEVYTRFNDAPGLRRNLWRIADQADADRVTAEHGSFHTPISGTAAHFCLRAIIECVRWLREDAVPARLVLTVHDSLMFEVREDCVPEVAWQVKRIMERRPMGDVPVVADIEVGPSWGQMEKYVVAP